MISPRLRPLPTLTFGDPRESEAAFRLAEISIKGLLAWPTDPDRLSDWHIVLTASALAEAERQLASRPPEASPEDVDRLTATVTTFHEHLSSLGGWPRLLHTWPRDFLERERKEREPATLMAGAVLLHTVHLSLAHPDLLGGGSMNEAIKLLTTRALVSPVVMHRSEQAWRRAWLAYRPVAHIAAALVLMMRNGLAPDTTPEGLIDLLRHAAAFEDAALALRPQRRHEGKLLLEPGDLFKIDRTHLGPPMRLSFRPFSEATLRAARLARRPLP